MKIIVNNKFTMCRRLKSLLAFVKDQPNNKECYCDFKWGFYCI